MMVAANHATSLAGTWPQATSLVATMTSITGVILATIAAWDAGHRTLSYQRATATSALRALTVITGPAVLCALVTFLSIAAVTSLAVLSVDTGGHPWWLTILSSLMWLIMCAVAGTATGYAIHRPSLAAVTALLASILCVISSMKARENGWLPRLIFLPGSPLEVVTRQQVLWIISLQIVSVLVLITVTLLALAAPINRRWALSSGVAALSTTMAAVGLGASGTNIGMEPRTTSTAQAVCTASIKGASFCSWPEDKHTVEGTSKHWNDFITILHTAGLPVPTGVYGQPGSGHDHQRSTVEHSPAGIFSATFKLIADHAESSRTGNVCPEYSKATKILHYWSIYSFRTPDDPVSIFIQDSSHDRQTLHWVKDTLSTQSPDEQARILAPIIHQAIGGCP